MQESASVAGAPDKQNLRTRSLILRRTILETHRAAGAGHLGGSLSMVEILTTIFEAHFHWNVSGDPTWSGDRFVLSKGHAALGFYCQMALLNRIAPDSLALFGTNGGELEPHPNETLCAAVHASTGSLGQGFSIALGLAQGNRMRGGKDRVFVVLGDGEINEGQVWEAAQVAGKLKLSNLIVIVDKNDLQQDGPMSEILPLPDLSRCWGAMGWVSALSDGHDPDMLDRTLCDLLSTPEDAPKLLIAQTIKGRGVPFLEGTTESHYPAPLSDEDLALVSYLLETENAHG